MGDPFESLRTIIIYLHTNYINMSRYSCIILNRMNRYFCINFQLMNFCDKISATNKLLQSKHTACTAVMDNVLLSTHIINIFTQHYKGFQSQNLLCQSSQSYTHRITEYTKMFLENFEDGKFIKTFSLAYSGYTLDSELVANTKENPHHDYFTETVNGFLRKKQTFFFVCKQKVIL